MTDKRDYYEVLGVARDASAADIRKSYKKLALQHHPDRNRDCADATEKFKEVTEAYSVLSDDDKRRRYDQFGHAGVAGVADAGGDIFSHFQDLFSDFFGGMGGPFGGGRRARGAERGRDMRVSQKLTLEEAVLGCKKQIRITTPSQCSACNGSGAKPGTQPVSCSTCGGRGQVSSGRGFILFTQTCPACQGEGTRVAHPCEACDGVGWEEKERTVQVTFPPGIDGGHRLRVSGQGLPGMRGGPPGHLYVDVMLEPHAVFQREGNDLITKRTLTFAQAALGTSLEVELLDGSTAQLTVPPGTQPGTVLTAAGRGAPSVQGDERGSLHVIVQVHVPGRLSRRARKLLAELDDELSDEAKAAESA